MAVLSWVDYSFVKPASAVSCGVVTLLSFFLLHEVVKPLHWLGLSIISCGVLMVGNTAARTSAIDSKRQLLFRVILRATTGNTPDSKGLN